MARKNVIEFIVKLVDDASKQLKQLEGGFKRFATTIIRQGALVAGAIATIAGTFLVLYRNMTKSYAEFDRFSESLGISVETLSQLEYAARQTGVGITTLKNAMENMSPAIDSAVDGIGIAAGALEELNLNAIDLNRLGMEDQLLVLADAFSKLESETRAVILSQDIFGDGASEIYRLLRGGSSAIIDYAKEADKLGITIQTKAAKEARLFREELAKLELMQRKLQQAIIVNLGPAIRDLAEWLVEVARAAGEAYDKFAPLFGLADTNMASLSLAYAQQQNAMDTFVEGVANGDRAIAQSMPAYQAMERRLASIAGAMKFFNDESAKAAKGGLAGKTVPGVGGADEWRPSEVDTVFPELTGITTATRRKDNRPPWLVALDEAVEESNKRLADSAAEYQRKLSFMQSLADQAARGIQQSMADFFFDPFEEGLDGMLKSFINVIRRMIAEWAAFQVLTFFGIGDFFSGAVGISGKASGGPVTAGRPYIVGERGPELFVPGASGSIIPNGGSGVGGMNFVTNIDARGADPGLIARLPQIFEQRDRQLMLKVREYIQTGTVSI